MSGILAEKFDCDFQQRPKKLTLITHVYEIVKI